MEKCKDKNYIRIITYENARKNQIHSAIEFLISNLNMRKCRYIISFAKICPGYYSYN